MIAWLEKHLAQSNTTLLMVTHDRYFLENVCDSIFELDDQTLYLYKGNYSYFLEKRSERQENALAQRDRARRTMRRELEWMRQTPAARTGKSKARIDAFYDLKAKARVRLEDDPMHIALNPARMGGKLVEFHKVGHGFGERELFSGLTHHFKKGERLGIVGANGAGKSTLLDLLVGLEAPRQGKVVIGDTVVFGHYSQHGADFPDGLKVIDAVREIAEFMPLQKGMKLTAVQLLERFLFPRTMHHLQISVLSGGEKKRLHLLQVLMRNPNFLILDEPTNDLDIFTLQVLEEFLFDFPGCLVIVSHDRYFMDRLVEHVWVLGEDGATSVRDYPGNYTQFRLAREESLKAAQHAAQSAARPTSTAATPEVKNDYTQRLSFKEKYEFDQLAPRIESLEAEKGQLASELESTNDHARIVELSARLSSVVAELDAAEMRWLELSERAD
jgi:ABC transport system ATP-binding/permease protein